MGSHTHTFGSAYGLGYYMIRLKFRLMVVLPPNLQLRHVEVLRSAYIPRQVSRVVLANLGNYGLLATVVMYTGVATSAMQPSPSCIQKPHASCYVNSYCAEAIHCLGVLAAWPHHCYATTRLS